MKGWRTLKLDELSNDVQKVYDILNQESDLACVLIGTSYLSELLASTLKGAFIDSSISESAGEALAVHCSCKTFRAEKMSTAFSFLEFSPCPCN